MKTKQEVWNELTAAAVEYATIVSGEAYDFAKGKIKDLENNILNLQETIRKQASLAASKDERIHDLNAEVVRLNKVLVNARNEGYETARKDISDITAANLKLQDRVAELEAKLRGAADGKTPTGDFVVNVYDDFHISVYFPDMGQNFISQKNELSLLSLSSRCLDVLRMKKGKDYAEERRHARGRVPDTET